MSQKFRFPLEIPLGNCENLEIVESTKILGLLISNNLKWSSNTDFVTSKAMRRIWTLRKLQKLGLNQQFILDVYIKEIRSILEYCVPLWNGGITQKESQKIENVQKIVMRILLKDQYNSYTEACRYFKIEKLHTRREKLCLNFAQKEYKKHNSNIFKKMTSKSSRPSNKKLVLEPLSRTERHYRSAIPYLSRLLNSNAVNQK